MKGIIWQGSCKSDLKSFSDSAVSKAGYQLFRVQCGLEPDGWKPMSSVGPGVREIRIRDTNGAFRVIYFATRPEAIYVLHCFQKKAEKTSTIDLSIARERLRSILR
jgi:phage-related protein